MYRYIGVVINDSSTYDIADAMVNAIFCEQLSIPRENQTILKVRNSLAGIYNAWHIVDEDTHEIRELLLLHHTYEFDDLYDNAPLCVGSVCTALAHAVCVVDERYHFDPCYSYYMLEKEAFYDGDEIIRRLPSSPYPNDIKQNLNIAIRGLRKQGKQPTGEDINNIINGYPIWDALSSKKIYSSHWSVDICNRLKSNIPAAVFKGGVISSCEPGFVTCYTYRNCRGMSFAIRINLEADDYTNYDDEKETAQVIMFPERTDHVDSVNFSGTTIDDD